jgi:hypothetical protein
MANFLNRLAGRAVGTAKIVQPVIPAVFTPEFGFQGKRELTDPAVEAIDGPSERTGTSESARRATLPKAGESSSDKLTDTASSNVTSGDSAADHERPARRDHSGQAVPHRVSLIPDSTDDTGELRPVFRRGPAEIDSSTFEQTPFDSRESELDRFSESRGPERPAQMAAQKMARTEREAIEAVESRRAIPAGEKMASSQRHRDWAASPEAPVIRVTIGRIDVRAQFTASAPSPATTGHKRPGALSLDEYLKQRSEGKR